MLKPIARDQTIGVISLGDDAIDHERSRKTETNDMLLYARTRHKDPGSWRDTVAFKDGEQPTVFEIGVIPSSEMVRIDDETNPYRDAGDNAPRRARERGWRCFLSGLRGIMHFGGEKPPMRNLDGVQYVDPEWLRATFVGHLRDVAIEIGCVVWSWNQLGADDLKNSLGQSRPTKASTP